MSSTIQADIEQQLAHVEPAVEVLLAEVVNGSVVRLFIDHPDGVTLALCERVTKHLAGVRETYADVAATLADYFELPKSWPIGVSFLSKSKSDSQRSETRPLRASN